MLSVFVHWNDDNDDDSCGDETYEKNNNTPCIALHTAEQEIPEHLTYFHLST